MEYTIIGAGIGGLTTALALERRGIDYKIFERASELAEVGAGIWLAPNALQVLESLGVLDEVQSKGNTIDRITLTTAEMNPLSDAEQGSVKRIFGYSTIAIHRARLQKLLFDQLPRNKVFLGHGFKAYRPLSSGKVEVSFDNGIKTETDYLIGADGINSNLRNQLWPDSVIRYSGQTCWRGVADIKIASEFEHRGIELWGDEVRFGLSKIAKDKVYWFAVAKAEAGQKDRDDTVQDKLLDMFKGFHPLCQKLIKATTRDKILRNDINDLKPLRNWHIDNVCLIGDAGHVTTPNMGQGGAQAIEDAYCLGQLIDKYPGQNVFAMFQKNRQRKVNTIVNQSWMTGKMAHWRYGAGVRNVILKSLPSSIMQKKLMDVYRLEKVS